MDYKAIGKALQIEGEICHNQLDGGYLSREAGISRFNEEAVANGLKELRDPKGYMALDDNVYQAIKDTYEDVYNQKAQDVEDGFSILQSTYALDAVLDKLDSVVRKDSKRFTPDGMVYGDLRFVRNTPEIQQHIDDMVNRRVEMTMKYAISRSVDDDNFRQTFEQYVAAGEALKNTIQPQEPDQSLTL